MNVKSAHLVGLLVTDEEPSQLIIKDVLRSIWRKMGNIKVLRAKVSLLHWDWWWTGSKANSRSPWFIKGAPFTAKFWPLYQSLDEIRANRAVLWVQVHGIPKNMCTVKNARMLGSKIGSILEVEDHMSLGFWGFLRVSVDIDASRPLLTTFNTPCPINGSRTLRLKCEDLRDFGYNCGHLGHVRGCQWSAPVRFVGENRYNPDYRASTISKHSNCLFPDWAPPARVAGVWELVFFKWVHIYILDELVSWI